ncbi:MAG: ferredoxin--NADP reductase [Halolamina sp.]
MTHTAELVDVYPMTPRVTGFRLRVPGHEFDFEPGQHTTVRFESAGETVVRPYTPTNLPGTDELTLTIKRYDDGLASAYMHTRRPGDEIEIGPIDGSLTLADPDRDGAFLATGTGLTPLLAILRRYLEAGSGHAHVVPDETDEASLLHRGTLNELAAEHDDLDVTFTLSDPGWKWTGRIGYVQSHLDDLFEGFDRRDFYVCGVPPMVVETTETLRELGAPAERIHTEGSEDGVVTDD